jgi:hypothetical protein
VGVQRNKKEERNMTIFDFLYYYLMLWFNKRQKHFKKMIPYERVSYGLGIMVIVWILCIDHIVEYFIFDSSRSIIPNFIFVIIALALMWLFDYIYVKKKRYENIVLPRYHESNISEKIGILISISTVILSFLIPMAVAVLIQSIHESK